jgi:hypothetical protein
MCIHTPMNTNTLTYSIIVSSSLLLIYFFNYISWLRRISSACPSSQWFDHSNVMTQIPLAAESLCSKIISNILQNKILDFLDIYRLSILPCNGDFFVCTYDNSDSFPTLHTEQYYLCHQFDRFLYGLCPGSLTKLCRNFNIQKKRRAPDLSSI